MIVQWHPLLYLFIQLKNATVKGKPSKPKSNQHQLAPINQSQTSDNHSTGNNDYNGGQTRQRTQTLPRPSWTWK